MRLGSRLVIGAVAGIVGTMAMTAAMRRLHARLPAEERYPLTPRDAAGSKAASGGSGASGIVGEAMGRPPDGAAKDITTAAHFAYGAACGALLSAANPRTGKAAGAAAGAAIWLASYMGWIPALTLLKPATEHPARRNGLMIAVHLVWGAATAAALRELSAARDIFADGADQDAASI